MYAVDNIWTVVFKYVGNEEERKRVFPQNRRNGKFDREFLIEKILVVSLDTR